MFRSLEISLIVNGLFDRIISLTLSTLPSVTSLAVPYFPNCLINGKIFEKNYCTKTVCLDFLYKFCLKYFSLEEFSEILS